jgi:hypothetical protein
MKTKLVLITITIILLFSIGSNPATAQDTIQPQEVTAAVLDAFSYQGYLEDSGAAVNNYCDFIITLYASLAGADPLGVAETRTNVQLNKGYFTVYDLDFDVDYSTSFQGDERYLSIQVRCPTNTGTYTTLTPRQKILPVPYATLATHLTSFNPNNRGASVNLNWYNDGANDWPRIRYGGNGQGASNGLLIQGSGDSTKMTILDNGNVGLGIGNVNPATLLDIAGGSVLLDASQYIYGNQTSGSRGFIKLYDGSTGNMELGTTFGTGNILFTAGGLQNVMIQSDGDVGIGTSNPLTNLDVREDAFYLQSGKNLGSINYYSGTGTLFQFASAQSYDNSGQGGGGFGMVSGNNVVSPIVWFYNAANNGFQVRKKGYDDTVQNGLKLFEVTNSGNSWVYGTASSRVVEIRGGSDFAEPFDILGAENVQPGMVVAIDPENPGQLRIAAKAYDFTVAGCVSGANGIQPGLVMQQEGSPASGKFPVALSGRVYCWVDATYSAVKPGDLLTTSATPGHAMKVLDYDLARGAIIGKAMSALEKGLGLVLVLVTLQ